MCLVKLSRTVVIWYRLNTHVKDAGSYVLCMYIFTYFDGLLTCTIPPSSASYTLVNKLWETFMNENIKNYVKKKLDLFLRKKYLCWYSTTNFRRQYYQKLRVILCKTLDLYCFKSDYLSSHIFDNKFWETFINKNFTNYVKMWIYFWEKVVCVDSSCVISSP